MHLDHWTILAAILNKLTSNKTFSRSKIGALTIYSMQMSKLLSQQSRFQDKELFIYKDNWNQFLCKLVIIALEIIQFDNLGVYRKL